jgi:hypothetical protein
MEPNEKWGVWTGLEFGDWWLCNSITHANRDSDPVAPWACWHCGQAWGCCQHGLARVVTTDRQLVWMGPYYSTERSNPFECLTQKQFIDRAALISRDTWNEMADSTDGMPRSESFPRITNHDVIHLGLQQRPECAIPP